MDRHIPQNVHLSGLALCGATVEREELTPTCPACLARATGAVDAMDRIHAGSVRGGSASGESKRRGDSEHYREMARRSAEARRRKPESE